MSEAKRCCGECVYYEGMEGAGQGRGKCSHLNWHTRWIEPEEGSCPYFHPRPVDTPETDADIPPIIGISGKAGCGKTVFADELHRLHPEYKRVSFGDAVKIGTAEYFGFPLAWCFTGKDRRVPGDGRRVRECMQWYGTDYMRREYGDDIWIQKVAVQIAGPTIIDDVRFHDEAEWIKEQGGYLIRLEPYVGWQNKAGDHESETALDDYIGWDLVISPEYGKLAECAAEVDFGRFHEKLIYVAGPYRASTEWGISENIRRAEEAAARLWREGWAVVCPHKNSAFMGGIVPDEVWLKGDLVMLQRCDAVYMLKGWENSQGATKEHAKAEAMGLDIYYEDYSDQEINHE